MPAGAWCLGVPVLRPHGRVLPAAVYGPPSKGPCMVDQQGDRCVAACQAGLDLVPGLSWTRGMLLYARLSGLMLGSVPGHVLSHVCGHVRSMCPVLGMQYSNTLIGM